MIFSSLKETFAGLAFLYTFNFELFTFPFLLKLKRVQGTLKNDYIVFENLKETNMTYVSSKIA